MSHTIGLIILGILYLLAACRYYPGEPLATLVSTLSHLLQAVPVAVALTYLVALVIKRVRGVWPTWPGLIRVLLLIALGFEFIYAMHHYYTISGS